MFLKKNLTTADFPTRLQILYSRKSQRQKKHKPDEKNLGGNKKLEKVVCW